MLDGTNEQKSQGNATANDKDDLTALFDPSDTETILQNTVSSETSNWFVTLCSVKIKISSKTANNTGADDTALCAKETRRELDHEGRLSFAKLVKASQQAPSRLWKLQLMIQEQLLN